MLGIWWAGKGTTLVAETASRNWDPGIQCPQLEEQNPCQTGALPRCKIA